MARDNDGAEGEAGGADLSAAMGDCRGTSPESDYYRSSSYIYIFTTTTLHGHFQVTYRTPRPKGTPPDYAGGAVCKVLRRGRVSGPWPMTPGRT